MATIKKVNNKYEFRLSLGRDEQGKRRQVFRGGFKKKADAEAEMVRILQEYNEGTYLEPSKQPFSDFMKKWFDLSYRKSVEETTANAIWYTVQNHLIPYFKNIPISHVSPRLIDQFYTDKLDHGFSPKYIREFHNLLNRAFSQAIKWSFLKENPVSKATPPKIKSKEVHPWTQEQAEKFLDLVKFTENEAFYIIAIFTGMRRGEILGLKWEDIDFDQGKIHVVRSLSRIRGKGLILKDVKTRKSKRQVSISPFVIEKLKKHLRQQKSLTKRLSEAYQNNGLVFTTFNGNPKDPNNVLREFNRYIKQANVPKISIHDLRHLHATLMLKFGENPKVVSERLGHSRVGITLDIYSHVTSDLQNEAALRYEQSFFQSKSSVQ
jgi:integrase